MCARVVDCLTDVNMLRKDEIWKTSTLAHTFLEGVRGGILFAAEQIEVMLRLLAARGEPVERFIDLGCGGGALAQAVLAQYPQAQAFLVDFSEPMLAQARLRLSDSAPQARFILADFAEPAWRQLVAEYVPCDAIVSGYAIHHQPDERKRTLYQEIFTLLKPGGLFVNVEHVASRAGWGEQLFEAAMIDSLYAFHAGQGSDKTREQVADEFFRRPDRDANILAPVEFQCDWLREIGFANVDCYFKAYQLAVFGGQRP